MYAWTCTKNKAFIFPCVCLSPLLLLFIFSWQHGTVTRDTHNIANKKLSLKPQGWIADTAQLWHSTVYPFSLHRKMVYPCFKFGFCLTFVAICWTLLNHCLSNMYSSSMRQVPWVPHCFIMSVVLGKASGPTIDLVTQVFTRSHSSGAMSPGSKSGVSWWQKAHGSHKGEWMSWLQ